MMLDRRAALHRAAFGGVLAALTTTARAESAGGEAEVQNDDAGQRAVAQAVQAVRNEIARQATFWEIAAVRDQLRTFLRTAGKFPDYIEVGSDVWQQVYDWHVRYDQPIAVGRTAEARYTIKLMETTVILRTDSASGFIGVPYDSR